MGRGARDLMPPTLRLSRARTVGLHLLVRLLIPGVCVEAISVHVGHPPTRNAAGCDARESLFDCARTIRELQREK
jgi:hypothetical protein